jgi:hypothetical protein
MISPARSPVKTRRRGYRLLAGGAAAVAAAALTVAASSGPAEAGPGATCGSAGSTILGSWYAQVYFPGMVFTGRTEATMITFSPGGGVVEANPINTSPAGNSGHWRQNPDCSFSVRLLNFTWDPVTSGTQQVLDVQLVFVLDDSTHFHSTAADATVYTFDPKSGQRIGAPLVIPEVSRTTAERFSTWHVPAQFPAQP